MHKRFWQKGVVPLVPLIVGAVIIVSAVVSTLINKQQSVYRSKATGNCGGVPEGSCCANGWTCHLNMAGTAYECNGYLCTPPCAPRDSDCTQGYSCCTAGDTCDAQSGRCVPGAASTCPGGTPVGGCCTNGKQCYRDSYGIANCIGSSCAAPTNTPIPPGGGGPTNTPVPGGGGAPTNTPVPGGGGGGGGTCPVPAAPSGLTTTCDATGTQMTILWTGASGADYYSLRVNNQSNGWDGNCGGTGEAGNGPGDFCRSPITGTSLTFPVNSGQSYDWWVHSRVNCNDAKWSGAPHLTSTCNAPCGSACTYQETRQTAINNYCNFIGTSCSGTWSNPMTCHGALSGSSCNYTFFGASCTPPYCDCVCVTPTTTQVPGAPTATLTPTPSITRTPTPTTTPIPGAPTATSTPPSATNPPPGCQTISPPPFATMEPTKDVVAGQVNIRWDSVPGAALYALRIDDKADDWPPARPGATNTCMDVDLAHKAGTNLNDICISGLTTNIFSYNFIAGHTYDWWVHAINSCGQYSASEGPKGIRAIAPTPTTTLVPGAPTATITPTPSITATPTPTTSISPTPSPTPSSPPGTTPTLPPDQRCSLGNDTYQKGQSYCDEAHNFVKTCTGNDLWQDAPDACPGQACSNDPAFHTYSCVAKCEALVNNPGHKLKIALLPENYTNYNEFKTAALNAIDEIKKTNLSPLVNKMNFYFVYDFTQSYHQDPSKPYEGLLFKKIHETGASVCGADSSIVIDNPSTCGNAQGGVSMLGLSSYACGSAGTVVPRQLSQAIVWLDYEFGDAGSPLGLRTIVPNCSDSSTCSKWQGMAGIGCFQGCGYGAGNGYSNWYRSSDTSIMREQGNYTFNPPSLKAWEDFLKNYQ